MDKAQLMRLQNQQRRFRHAHIPPNTEHMTFESFECQPGTSLHYAYETVCELANDDGGLTFVTILGGVDRGKTHLGLAACRHVLGRGLTARYAFVPLLLDELRADIESHKQSFDHVCRADFLVLDDLGAEYGTAWARERLEALVDYRYLRRSPMLVLTNVPLGELSARIASRLQRIQMGRVIVLTEGEYRLR